jgi:hypothetical protein
MSEEIENSLHFIVKFNSSTMVWRNIKTLMLGRNNYYEFEINPIIYKLPYSIQSNFIKGFDDAASMPSEKDYDGRINRQRIVLQFPHDNWKLPVQMCKLLQECLDVSVIHIMYGHPSLGRGFREHRMRIYPEEFVKIGYGFQFKQEILNALIEKNSNQGEFTIKKCNPKQKRIPQRKPKKSQEKDERLPDYLRKHFNSYWQICKACKCKQGKKSPQAEMTLDEENND